MHLSHSKHLQTKAKTRPNELITLKYHFEVDQDLISNPTADLGRISSAFKATFSFADLGKLIFAFSYLQTILATSPNVSLNLPFV